MSEESVGSFARGARLFDRMMGTAEARRVRAAWRKLEPDFERYVLTFLAGEIWSRPGLDRRTRSLCTIAALAALGRIQGLALNIRMALRNGATRSEIVEVLLHIAVYAGFPAAWEALALAGDIFAGGARDKPKRLSLRSTKLRGAH